MSYYPLRIFFLATLVAGTMGATTARADLMFDVDISVSGSEASSFGTVTLSQNGVDTVHVLLELASGLNFKGDDLVFAFNIEGAPTVTTSNLTAGFTWYMGGSPVYPAGSTATTGSNTITFGNNQDFMYALGCTDTNVCGPGGSNPQFPGPLEFDISASGLTPYSFITNLNGDHYFALDDQTGGTQFADVCFDTTTQDGICIEGEDPPGPREIPEPATLALFGAGLLGYAAVRRRRRNSA